MRVGTNDLSRTQSVAAQNAVPNKEAGLKIIADFDTVQVSRYTALDENGIPKNFLVGEM